ncbi:MAG: YaaL family protein [Bacillota bacterium]
MLAGPRGTAAVLVEEIDRARHAWHLALHNFDFASAEYVDFAVFTINAAECCYTALLKEAKKKGVVAWREEELAPVATGTGANDA